MIVRPPRGSPTPPRTGKGEVKQRRPPMGGGEGAGRQCGLTPTGRATTRKGRWVCSPGSAARVEELTLSAPISSGWGDRISAVSRFARSDGFRRQDRRCVLTEVERICRIVSVTPRRCTAGPAKALRHWICIRMAWAWPLFRWVSHHRECIACGLRMSLSLIERNLRNLNRRRDRFRHAIGIEPAGAVGHLAISQERFRASKSEYAENSGAVLYATFAVTTLLISSSFPASPLFPFPLWFPASSCDLRFCADCCQLAIGDGCRLMSISRSFFERGVLSADLKR